LHKIVDNDPGAMEWTRSDLASLSRYIESKGKLRVVTIHEAQTASFDNKGIYASIAGKSITNTISPDGTVYYSKTPTGHPRINATILPSSNPVSISIAVWNTTGDYKVVFNESSANTSNEIRYQFGDRQADVNYSVNIYLDNGTLFKQFYIKSNASGYISYNSTAGFGNLRHTVIQPMISKSQHGVDTASEIAVIYKELLTADKIIGAIAAIVIIGCIACILQRFVR
ncbi:MAG TPA: hypothetical protein VIO11_09320, partial [Candidatus Methanoperedens sp.]